MDKENAKKLFNIQLEQIEQLKKEFPSGYPSPSDNIFSINFKEWNYKTQNLIDHLFGENSGHSLSFSHIIYLSKERTRNNMVYVSKKQYILGLEYAEVVIKACIHEIEHYEIFNNRITLTPKLNLEIIFSRFDIVVKQLSIRGNNKAVFEINDEYDVQYLLHAILKLYFDDIRPEEPTQSLGGKSARIDFVIKDEKCAIEVKFAKKNHENKKIGDELAIDIQRYQKNPDCKILIFFIYDPEKVIQNPVGFEKDYTKNNDLLKIITYVNPK